LAYYANPILIIACYTNLQITDTFPHYRLTNVNIIGYNIYYYRILLSSLSPLPEFLITKKIANPKLLLPVPVLLVRKKLLNIHEFAP
jgi:hypothetical protein